MTARRKTDGSFAKGTVRASARSLAVEELNRVEVGGAYVDRLEAGGDREYALRVVRQTTDYVAGITRWRRWLDFLVQQYYRGDFSKMEPTLKQILRVGLYDLFFLSTPPHAALNEAVELAKRMVRPQAGRLVNGLLRAIWRTREELPEPPSEDRAEYLAVLYSHPTWMVRRWLARYDEADVERLLRWNNERPVYGLRINLLKVSREDFAARLEAGGIEWEPSAYLDDFVCLPRLQPVRKGGWFDEGLCAVQDESAGLIVRVLDPQAGDRVIDGCAAPGGKTLYAAQRMANRGRLLAVDVHAGRLRLVEEAAEKQGIAIIETVASDLRDLVARGETPPADRVLLDAPCSGLGVLAKRADLRWNRTPEDLAQLTGLQDALLDAAATLVQPGGVLVYSTCTIEPEENEDRVAAFLGRHPAFHLESARPYLPEPVVTPEGYFATVPHHHRIDGAFAARLRRTS